MRTLALAFILFSGIALATPPYHANQVVKKDVVVVKEKVVEFDADYYLGLDGYYAAQDKAVAEHGSGARLERLESQVDILIKALADKYNLGGETKPKPVTPEVSPPSGDPKPVDSLNAQVFTIFKKNCITCHGPNQAAGKLKLIGRDNQGDFLVDVGLKAFKVYDRVAGIHLQDRGLDLMPLNKQPLSDEDVQTIWVWAISSLKE